MERELCAPLEAVAVDWDGILKPLPLDGPIQEIVWSDQRPQEQANG